MKKLVTASLIALIGYTNSCPAFYEYFWVKEQKQKKLAFAEKVISEFFPEEERENFKRLEDYVSYWVDDVEVKYIKPGEDLENYSERVTYGLCKEDHDVNEQDFPRNIKIYTQRELRRELYKKGGYEKFNYEVVQESPNDVIFTAEGLPKDSEVGEPILFISRRAKVGNWAIIMCVRGKSSAINQERRKEWVDRMKNASSVNNWLAANGG